ncbi:NAD(P)-binding domain-containing protein [Bacteroidota bacterium]
MNLGFIGTGEISSAVVTGISTSELKDIKILLSPRNEKRGKELEKKFANVKRAAGNRQVLDESNVVFLALRPEDAAETLKQLKFRKDHTIISLIPYLKMKELKELTYPASVISRAVPLPSVMIHKSPVPVFNPTETALNIFKHIGEPLVVEDENHLHVLWTLTGLIAPFYDLLGSLSKWAVSKGIETETANKYAADLYHSVLSATRKRTPVDFEELVKHASTPGGMNEQTRREIAEKKSHDAYITAAENLLKLFD